ncbi:MAG: phosphoribosylanthranilate isomerase, partial [Oscillospiraceae bacterium]|nr:phosphoribosylanthranilate isomerase [Oscillospiraceae bacterium]
MLKLKLCGLRRPCDVLAANECTPDYIGFVFAPSRRQVSPDAAAALRALLAPGIQ